MKDRISTRIESENDKDTLPGPLTKEESQALRQFWEEIIESLEAWTEEEIAAFDSTLRHPPPLKPFTPEEIERNRQMLDQLEGLLNDLSEEELAAFVASGSQVL
jgi:hypothetical protein